MKTIAQQAKIRPIWSPCSAAHMYISFCLIWADFGCFKLIFFLGRSAFLVGLLLNRWNYIAPAPGGA
jgi:hypothetical protein